MLIGLDIFEDICRRAHIVDESTLSVAHAHPFEKRDLFPGFPAKVRKLFDDGHYSESTFEALKYLDKKVQAIASSSKSGVQLMMQAFGGHPPVIHLNALSNQSELDEQEGFKFIFAGIMSAIRNPKGHEHSIEDDPDTCLAHLALVSTLLRRLEQAGYDIAPQK